MQCKQTNIEEHNSSSWARKNMSSISSLQCRFFCSCSNTVNTKTFPENLLKFNVARRFVCSLSCSCSLHASVNLSAVCLTKAAVARSRRTILAVTKFWSVQIIPKIASFPHWKTSHLPRFFRICINFLSLLLPTSVKLFYFHVLIVFRSHTHTQTWIWPADCIRPSMIYDSKTFSGTDPAMVNHWYSRWNRTHDWQPWAVLLDAKHLSKRPPWLQQFTLTIR